MALEITFILGKSLINTVVISLLLETTDLIKGLINFEIT